MIAANLRVVAALATRSVKQTFRRPQLLAPIVVFPSILLAIQTAGAGRAVDLPQFPAVHGFLAAPTLFWIDASDHALRVAAVGGAVLSCGLVFNVAPRIALAACWLVYLSFVTIGQDFLETAPRGFATFGRARLRANAPVHFVEDAVVVGVVFRFGQELFV